MNYVKIKITENMKSFAKNQTELLAEALKGKNLHSRFNTDWEQNNITGYLGECIFAEWIRVNEIAAEWQYGKLGESDDYDFLISGKKWDVKTNLRKLPIENISDTYGLCVHKDQVGLHADYYVWVLIHGIDPLKAEFGYIMGYLPANKIKEAELYTTIPEKNVQAYRVKVNDAFPMSIAERTMRENIR